MPPQIDPTAPTEIKADPVNQTIQTVVIDPDGRIRDQRVQLVLLLRVLGELQDHHGGDLKAAALEKRVKYVEGAGGDGGVGELRLQKVPRVPVTRWVVNAIAERALADKTPLHVALLDLAEAGVITVNKTKLEELWGKVPVDALCEDGVPNAPSMVFTSSNAPEPAAALATLLSLSKKKPNLFKVPEKPRGAKKAEPAGAKPKLRYVEGPIQGL